MSGRFVCVIFLLSLFVKVEGWPCVTPILKIYGRVNTDAVLHFTADLRDMVAARQFAVVFYDNSVKALIRFNTDKTYTTDSLDGVNITGNASGAVIVTLEKVQLSSAGIYYMSRAGFLTRCNCLYILGIPKKPKLSVSNSPSVGGNVSLSCSSTSTTTPSNHSLSLAYSWIVDNVNNPSGTRFSYSANRNTITLSNLAESDNDMKFTCTAREDVSDGYTSIDSDTITFRAIYGPRSLKFSPNETAYALYEFTNFSPVTCSAVCYPACSYKWSKIGQVPAVSSTSVLHLSNVTRADAGTYRCTGSTSGGFSSTKDLIINIFSFFVGGHESMKKVILDENAVDIEFTCIIGKDISSAVKIMFNGETLMETEDRQTQSLTFKRRTMACTHSGVYTCEGSYLSEQVKMNVTVFVKCLPRPLRQVKRNITVSLYVPVTLSFTAIAYPEPGPNGFTWQKENDLRWTPLLSNEDLQILSSGLQTNVTIWNVSRQDLGQYRLIVTNENGHYEQYIYLAVEELRDDSVKDCSNTTPLIVSVSLGIVSAVLAAYSVFITIWVKRNMANTGGLDNRQRRKDQTYINEDFTENIKMNEPSQSPKTKEVTESEYSTLDDNLKDKNVAYEVLKTTRT